MVDASYESLLDVCVSAAMTSVKNMNYDQVGELLNDDDDNKKIDDIVDSISQVSFSLFGNLSLIFICLFAEIFIKTNVGTLLQSILISTFQVRTLPTEREMGLVQNKSLAEWNLSQEPKIEEAKRQLQTTYEEAVKVKEEVMELKEKLSKFSAFSFRSINCHMFSFFCCIS